MVVRIDFYPSDVTAHPTTGGRILCRSCGKTVWAAMECTAEELNEAREDHIAAHEDGYFGDYD